MPGPHLTQNLIVANPTRWLEEEGDREIQKGRQQKGKARDRRRMRHEGKSSSKSVNERQRRRNEREGEERS